MSHMDYGDCVYDIASKEQLNRLQILQNVSLRCILSRDARAPVFELHVDLNMLPLVHRRHLRKANECYKAVHIEEYSLTDFFVPIVRVGGCRTRAESECKMVEPRAINNSGKRSFGHAGPRLWNKIPGIFRGCESLDIFKREYRSYVASSCHQGKIQDFPT